MSFNPKQQYLVIDESINIDEFHKYKEDYVTRPPYQRKNVWSVKKQQNLLDSIFRRYYIPRIVVREVRLDNNRTVREIIDGQQRILTVQNFFSGKLKLPKSLNDIDPDLPGKSYKELDVNMRRFVDRELKYSADIVKNIEDPKNTEHQTIATEIFWRLQQGESLNYMEIAHAKLSSLLRNIIVKYSDDITFDYDKYIPLDKNPDKHKFFNIIDRKNERMQHLMLMTRFLLIEYNNGVTELNDTAVVDFIDKFIQDDGIGNYTLENHDFAKLAISNLNTFYDIFKEDPMLDKNSKIKELKREYIIVSLYLLLRHLRGFYVFNKNEKKLFYDFFIAFHDRWNDPDDSDTDILQFSSHRQQGFYDVEARHMIIRQLFFQFANDKGADILTKDEKRNFNETERIKIYRNNKGLCKMCLDEGKSEKEATVSWHEYDADHIIPHAKGGETIIDNAQVLCRYHNQSKGKK